MIVNVITGFLGSGKTTFIQNAIAEMGLSEKIAILVNDFGDIGVDGIILNSQSENVVELPHGCICCTLRMELITALEDIIKRFSPERIIIEPSGIASPKQILDILISRKMMSHYSITCIVDASCFLTLLIVLEISI